MKSFVALTGPILQQYKDPAALASALQDKAKFGIDTTTGEKSPKYVSDLVSNIKGVRPIIRRRRA